MADWIPNIDASPPATGCLSSFSSVWNAVRSTKFAPHAKVPPYGCAYENNATTRPHFKHNSAYFALEDGL
jgi:hypothetical protein